MKLSLANSFAILSDIMRQIEDNGGAFEDWMLPKFEEGIEGRKAALDRRGFFLEEIEVKIKHFKEKARLYSEQATYLQKIQERVEATTLAHLKEAPELEPKGNDYTFSVCKNGGKQPIEWRIKLQELKNIIDPFDSLQFEEKYLRKVQVFVLEKENFERDLRDGLITSEAATVLPRGEHLRIK
jgi:hypothetical protein